MTTEGTVKLHEQVTQTPCDSLWLYLCVNDQLKKKEKNPGLIYGWAGSVYECKLKQGNRGQHYYLRIVD